MNADQPIMETVRLYFREQLLPRSKGLIGVVEHGNSFLITLGRHPPFMILSFSETTIDLAVNYPSQIRAAFTKVEPVPVWSRFGPPLANPVTIEPFSKKEKERVKQLAVFAPKEGKKITLEKDQFYSTIKFDVFQADSFGRAEFYIHTIITKIKYLVTNTGWNGHRPKADIELGNLIEEAEKEYKRKVLQIGKRKR